MLRVTAPEPITGRIEGIPFVDGAAEVEALSRPIALYFATRGFDVAPLPEPTPDHGAVSAD